MKAAHESVNALKYDFDSLATSFSVKTPMNAEFGSLTGVYVQGGTTE